MTISLEAFLTISAVLLSPLLAVQATKLLETGAKKRSRRVAVYRSLMATRAQRLSPTHIEALNSIDLEFTQRGDRKIRDAWKALLAHFNDEHFYKNQQAQWAMKHVDLLGDLLFEMGRRLGYDFDKTHLKTAAYSPQAYDDLEMDLTAIRKGFRQILEGRGSLPVKLEQETNGE